MPIEPWWDTNPATTPLQELGMVSPELGTELGIRTIPTYSVYGTIARPLRPSPESGFLLMAEARLQRVGSLPSVIAFVVQATHPAGALLRDRQPAA